MVLEPCLRWDHGLLLRAVAGELTRAELQRETDMIHAVERITVDVSQQLLVAARGPARWVLIDLVVAGLRRRLLELSWSQDLMKNPNDIGR
jgi:hypothetical protein